jgi:glycosyltransferase involved in cell wall biosynthesis
MNAVCFLLQNVYDGDARVRRKAEALAAAGYCVDVLALTPSPGKKKYALNGVNVYTVSLGKKRGSLARYMFEYAVFFFWAFARLLPVMGRRRYAVIDVNTLPDFLIFAALPGRLAGAKLILDMHGITPEFYMSKYQIGEGSWWVRTMKFLERISFSFADRVITINEPIQDLLIGRGLPKDKSTVIANAADETRFASYSKSCAADEAKSTAGFVMIYHGTLTKLYGLDIAIEAFAIAQEEMPGAELWILGGGPEAGSLKSLAQQRGLDSKVRLIGIVSPSEVPAWLEKSDAGILPIRRDVFLEYASPNKLGEYIIMGKAVVISRLRATQRYFSENALAYFEPNNTADLAKQMIRIYRDRELRNRMAAQARREYAPISWDIMKQRYLTLMDHLVKHTAGADDESRSPKGAK